MTRTERLSGTWARVAVVVVASFLGGMATFFAQGLLPGALTSFANSASGWTLVTVLLLAWARVSTALSAVLGVASFALLTVGYSVSAQMQGLYYDPTLFVVVGVVVGPFIGVATSWLRAESGWRAAAGTALLAGIGLGEAVFGLTAVADTTSPVYWILIGVIGLGLLVGMLLRRIRGAVLVVLTVVGTAAVAGAFVAAYGALGTAPLS
ncbi:hypothetical protein J4G33_12315 [Actinotalea sp. BY-33]|uniref:Uncharacterized protein n=1 Tax=Actinotalea soli TaxID=2819234 RepID=A0A939RWF6_9CELL|nr:DUF6518 family protein [Actinotalea soli]MBO1752588.1 hypothetical protein [Actinotalea soli]